MRLLLLAFQAYRKLEADSSTDLHELLAWGPQVLVLVCVYQGFILGTLPPIDMEPDVWTKPGPPERQVPC